MLTSNSFFPRIQTKFKLCVKLTLLIISFKQTNKNPFRSKRINNEYYLLNVIKDLITHIHSKAKYGELYIPFKANILN